MVAAKTMEVGALGPALSSYTRVVLQGSPCTPEYTRVAVGGAPTPEPRLEGCLLPTAQGQRMAFKREIR